jgi:hypothetical protein
MMSPETIRSLSRQAARRSRELGVEPLVVHDHDRGVLSEHLRHIPNLGDRVPRGWKRVPARTLCSSSRGLVPFSGPEAEHFIEVDASGWGSPGELALTFGEFCQWASEAPGENAYAIVEEGQFQVVIGVFRRR